MGNKKIFVTKTFLPPMDEYNAYIKQIFESGFLTNQGKMLEELELKLSAYLNVKNFQYVTNGTIALQLALNALDILDGEIITTPFSYVATTTAIIWERCTPVFVDIEPDNFTMNVDKIEAAITPRTRAIMPVHVFGYACDVEKIQEIADKYGLKVIYDGAHAFASRYKNKSLLSFGDVSTCSFHATKLYHTIEGGGCVIFSDIVSDKLNLIKCFGHDGKNFFIPGINGKQSEFHAAMGLVNFAYLDEIISKRKVISDLYDKLLSGLVVRPKAQKNLEYNYAYYPVVFENEQELLNVFSALAKNDIYPRRYFYPSLNKLDYIKNTDSCPISEDISLRVACLPLFPDLEVEKVKEICNIIESVINHSTYESIKD